MRRPRRSQQRLFWLLSALVALSMVCSSLFFLMDRPQERPPATPTRAFIPPAATPFERAFPTVPPTLAPPASPTPAVSPSASVKPTEWLTPTASATCSPTMASPTAGAGGRD